jgi:hypothetical protein
LQGVLRRGDWLYFQLVVTDEQAHDRLFYVDVDTTATPHAQTLLLLRRGQVPRLMNGFLPTLDAFIFDWADPDGFTLLKGLRQTIIIPKQELSEGLYYIGLYNIWGYTGLEDESHDEANYTLYKMLYAAGMPCRRHRGRFCSGFPCDFNTGNCSCPVERLGLDCGTVALPLLDGIPVTGRLSVEESSYYIFNITQGQIDSGNNVVITLDKPLEQNAYAYLMARRGSIPYSYDYSQNDAHDLTATFYRSARHRILLDNTELSAGVWYLGVVNAEKSQEDLTYNLQLQLLTQVECSVGSNGNT